MACWSKRERCFWVISNATAEAVWVKGGGECHTRTSKQQEQSPTRFFIFVHGRVVGSLSSSSTSSTLSSGNVVVCSSVFVSSSSVSGSTAPPQVDQGIHEQAVYRSCYHKYKVFSRAVHTWICDGRFVLSLLLYLVTRLRMRFATVSFVSCRIRQG